MERERWGEGDGEVHGSQPAAAAGWQSYGVSTAAQRVLLVPLFLPREKRQGHPRGDPAVPGNGKTWNFTKVVVPPEKGRVAPGATLP